MIVPQQCLALTTKPLSDSIIHAGDFYGQSPHCEWLCFKTGYSAFSFDKIVSQLIHFSVGLC